MFLIISIQLQTENFSLNRNHTFFGYCFGMCDDGGGRAVILLFSYFFHFDSFVDIYIGTSSDDLLEINFL